jgi:hypothetical protein
MNPNEKRSLIEQRSILRHELLAQRLLIAAKIAQPPAKDTVYPRSMTMLFLTRKPEFVIKLLAQCATMLIGARRCRSKKNDE